MSAEVGFKLITNILILITLWLTACAVSFFVGLYIGRKDKPKKPVEELTEEQKRIVEKIKKETENFWSYSGEKQ